MSVLVPKTKVGGVRPAVLQKQINADVAIAPVCESVIVDEPPAGPNDFDLQFDVALSAPENTALDAVIAAHDAVPTSPAFKMWESTPTQSTPLETYQDAMTRTAPRLAAGKWRAMWFYEWRVVGAGGSKGQTRVRIAGVVKGVNAVTDTDWRTAAGWDRLDGVKDGDQPALEIEFRRKPGTGPDTIEIRKLKLSIERLDT